MRMILSTSCEINVSADAQRISIPVFVFCYGNCKMKWSTLTRVHVTGIFWYQIYIMEHIAVIVLMLLCFYITNIHQCCTVEKSRVYLQESQIKANLLELSYINTNLFKASNGNWRTNGLIQSMSMGNTKMSDRKHLIQDVVKS